MFIMPSNSDSTCSSWSVCHPVGMWYDAALSRIVRNITLAVCWKGTLDHGCLHFLSVSVPVFLLYVDISSM